MCGTDMFRPLPIGATEVQSLTGRTDLAFFIPRSQWRASHLAILICDGCHSSQPASSTNLQRFHIYKPFGRSMIAKASTLDYQQVLTKNQEAMTD
jgi:hypothetical protein